MAKKAIRLYNTRGQDITPGGSNRLYRSARQTYDRRWIPNLDEDYHRNVSGLGRRTMMTVGRWLYANFPQVRTLVNDILDACTGSFETSLRSADGMWNEMAEEVLSNHDKIADVRGRPFNNRVMRRMQLKAALVDGDGFILLTHAQGNPDYPMFQFIPAHRVYSNQDENQGNNTLADGVIYNSVGRAVAYRVYSADMQSYTDVSANDIVPCFKVDYPDQLRGNSILACGLFDMQDCQEAREFELKAQKITATIGLIEYNEKGEARTEDFGIGAESTNDIENAPTGGLHSEVLEDSIRYFKAGSGSRLESLRHDRPTQNQANFEERITRDVFGSVGWSYYFSIDPTTIGGASMRVVLDRLNQTKRLFQSDVLAPTEYHKDLYRIAKLIGVGEIPNNEQWSKISYVGGPDLTADKKYDAQVSEMVLKNKTSTLRIEAAKKGVTSRELIDERIREQKLWNEKREAADLPPEALYPEGSVGDEDDQDDENEDLDNEQND